MYDERAEPDRAMVALAGATRRGLPVLAREVRAMADVPLRALLAA